MKKNHDYLRKEFHKETGKQSFRTQFDADIEYVIWLETKITGEVALPIAIKIFNKLLEKGDFYSSAIEFCDADGKSIHEEIKDFLLKYENKIGNDR